VNLYRTFPWDKSAGERDPGGVLYVPRDKQGPGRHDLPHLDGVLYCSLTPQSAVAEFIQGYRGKRLRKIHLQRPDNLVIALGQIALKETSLLLNLDDPEVLLKHKLRPSGILTHDRSITRALAERLYNAGATGLLWPSALEASWLNASIFVDRSRNLLSAGKITPLQLTSTELIQAATWLNIEIEPS